MIINAKRIVIGEHYSARIFEDYAPQIRERLRLGYETTVLLVKPQSIAADYLKASGSGHGGISANLEKIRTIVVSPQAGPGTRPKANGGLAVKWHGRVLRYSFVMSEDAVWVRLFTNSEGFSLVPAFCVERSTPLYEFFLTDITKLLEQSEDGSI